MYKNMFGPYSGFSTLLHGVILVQEICHMLSRGYLLFEVNGEYQIYFIEYVENIRILMFSIHEIKYIWYLPPIKVNFLFILYSL